MNVKCMMEVALFPISIAMLFMGRGNLFLLMFYANFLRIKYVLNTVTNYINIFYIENAVIMLIYKSKVYRENQK